MTPIAIVGLGCRFPNGEGLQRYWQLLCNGGDAVREVPPHRWDVNGTVARWAGLLEDIEGFDADFFGISAREAARMDPQQRLVLEVAWEAIEDAGLTAGGLDGSPTGVLMGVSTYDHGIALHAWSADPEPYDGTGGALSIVANRLSYCLNLRGPSIAVDTACSSSLVAVHLACQMLSAGEVDLAIAGGVNVITSPGIAASFCKSGLMASDGRCKPFDHRADGYVRSEGAGVVVLKRLDRALADHDRVYAVVRGGAVNQDGRTNGLTAPNRLSQESVLRAAYHAAKVDPAIVDYVEAHGTGTAVGDPIEIAALASVFGPGRDQTRPLRVGSVKSNLGHLEASAGVAGLIKLALALHHRFLPQTVHFEKPNPMLGLEHVPVQIQSRAELWSPPDGVAMAGVSSFGFGGTNAHLVVASPPAPATGSANGTDQPLGEASCVADLPQLVPVSARSWTALARRAAAWVDTARSHAGSREWFLRAASAAGLRADHHWHRAAIVAVDAKELADSMAAVASGERGPSICPPRMVSRRPPRAVFVFPGQGAQWAGMGRQLARSVPAFRDAIRRCDAAIGRWLGRSLWGDEAGLVAEGTANVQPALFAIQVALAETWRTWGIEPAAVVGHSMGEIAAAYVSGALHLDDAARLACERSRLLAEISGKGGLALVELAEKEARELVRDREHQVSVAAVNGPRATILSGAPQALDDLLATLSPREVFARRVAVEFAAHSPQVDPLAPRLAAALAGLTPHEASIPLYSTVTGGPISGTDLGPEYWATNLRATVRFESAMARVLADGGDAFVEITPHPALARSIADLVGKEALVVGSMRRDQDELRGMLRALGELHTFGVTVDWRALYPPDATHVPLPPHGWNHRRFPTIRALPPTPARPEAPLAATSTGDLLGGRVRVGTDPALRLWTLPFDLAARPELTDHQVEQTVLVPATYWLVAAAQAACRVMTTEAVVIEETTFLRPCLPGEDGVDERQLALRPLSQVATPPDKWRFSIMSCRTEGNPIVHAEGTVRAAGAGEAPTRQQPGEVVRRRSQVVSVDKHYQRFETAGVRYGPRFRGLAEIYAGEREALARVRLPEGLAAGSAPLHPALLDACLHTVAAAFHETANADVVPLPAAVRRVWARCTRGPLRNGWCHASLLETTERELVADVTVWDDSGEPVWSASDLRVRLVDAARPPAAGRLYELRWRQAPDQGHRGGQRTEAGPGTAIGRGSWLILADRAGVAHTLVDTLTRTGESCLVENALESDVTSMLDLADSAAGGLRGVIDARALTADPEPPHLPAARTLPLIQTLAQRSRHAEPIRLWLLTTGTQLHGAAPIPPAGAALWGLGRALANELPELGCSLADLTWAPDERDLRALAAAVCSAEPPSQVVVRSGEVRTPGLVPVVGESGHAPPRIRPDRTYLLTGGYGALGILLAQWLVDRGARHLLLIGRSPPSRDAKQALATLRNIGVEVRGTPADVAEAAQLDVALRGLGTDWPPLAGVFHLAGTLEDALITELGTDALRVAMAGKAAGAWNLHLLTRDQPIEMFVLFSSLAGLLGSPGQAAYAAASTYLDALAGHRDALGLPALSIDWGTWAGSGLAAAAGSVDRLAARGLPPLAPSAAFGLLDAALGSGRSQVVAAVFERDKIARAIDAAPAARLMLKELMPQGQPTAPAAIATIRHAVLAHQSAAARRRAIHELLVAHLTDVLQVPGSQLDVAVPFQDLGFDSLMAIELRNRLEGSLGIKLSAATIYAFPTAETLADELLDRLASPQVSEEPAVGLADGGVEQTDDGLSQLDEDQVATLLTEELGEFGELGVSGEGEE